jgi:hypothetical protein
MTKSSAEISAEFRPLSIGRAIRGGWWLDAYLLIGKPRL